MKGSYCKTDYSRTPVLNSC